MPWRTGPQEPSRRAAPCGTAGRCIRRDLRWLKGWSVSWVVGIWLACKGDIVPGRPGILVFSGWRSVPGVGCVEGQAAWGQGSCTVQSPPSPSSRFKKTYELLYRRKCLEDSAERSTFKAGVSGRRPEFDGTPEIRTRSISFLSHHNHNINNNNNDSGPLIDSRPHRSTSRITAGTRTPVRKSVD